MSSRHRSRELAVQMAFQWEVHPESMAQDVALERFWQEQARSSDDNRPFFELLVRGMANHLPQIDEVIEKSLQNWKFARVAKVDLAILRVAVFEMLYSEDSQKPDLAVSINEALEMAKKFGSADSASFINGVLDSIAQSLKKP
jgi:transcription antitermination protein NusB